MSKSADEREHEVEASRSKLDQTLDSLQSRLNVSGVTANLMNPEWRARTLHGNTDRFVGTARANPLPVLLILGGPAWLPAAPILRVLSFIPFFDQFTILGGETRLLRFANATANESVWSA